jgi:hypothetical protein
VADFLTEEIGRFDGGGPDRARSLYARFRAAVLAQPDQHGWRIEGRLTSYVDEDVFAVPTSVGQWVDAAPDADAARLKAAILGEYPSVSAFLDHCYHSTCARFRAGVAHDLAPGAERVLAWLLRERVSVVFASNAPLEKIQGWFACHGLEVADARDTEPGSVPLRAYGRAGKQWLGPAAGALEFGGRRVESDRPQYRAILEREHADFVIGDVLSLDLATPLMMRRAGDPAAPRLLALMHLRHTPRWALSAVGEGGVDQIIAHVTEMPRLIHRLREPSPITATLRRSG